MPNLGLIAQFILAKARYAVTPKPPRFELSSAESSGEVVTDMVRTILLATGGGRQRDVILKRRLVIYYRFMGRNHYAYYFDPGEKLVFPPDLNPAPMKIEDLVLSAEVGTRDVTELATMLAGPDGRWGGRLNRETPQGGGKFDLRLLYNQEEWKNNESLHILFGDMSEMIWNAKEKTQ